VGKLSRAREVAVAIDQLANAVLGGYAQETISSRCWRLRGYRPYSTMRWIIDWVFFWQTDHCRASYEAQVERRNMPADYAN
jgi:hypothetical protein